MVSTALHRCVLHRRASIVGWLVFVATVASAPAATIAVPTDRPTIQSAIDGAGRGDVIVVQPGDYAENLGIGPATTASC